jgi:hypothetical protein
MLPNHQESPQPAASVSRLEKIVDLVLQPWMLLTAVHLSILALRLPLLERLPGWFFRLRPKSIGPWYLVLALAAVPAVGWLMGRAFRTRRIVAVWLLILLGFGLQHGFAWSEGRQFDGIRKSIVTTGHAEFAAIAAQQPKMWDVLVEYEGKLEREELGRYSHSKPPGTLLFYMVTERLARGLARDDTPEARLEATRNLAAFVWPLLAYLPLLPLFVTLRRFVGEDTSFVACLLYLVIPSVTLMTLHTDQFLFPLLYMLTTWIAVEAQRRHSWAWAFATGASLYLSAFFTFALLLAIPMAAAFAVAAELETRGRHLQAPGRALAKTGLAAAAGFGTLAGVFGIVFQYDLITRLRGATDFHAAWRNWQGGWFETIYFGWLDSLEFAVWLGVPLTVLALAAGRRAILQAIRGDYRKLVLPAMVLGLSFLYLAFFGRTKAESARLWLFLVPMCSALAATELAARYPEGRTTATAAVLALQWLTVCLTKTGQDFW